VGIFPPSLQHSPADLTGRATGMRYQEFRLSAFVLSAAIASDNRRHAANMRLRHADSSRNRPTFRRIYRGGFCLDGGNTKTSLVSTENAIGLAQGDARNRRGARDERMTLATLPGPEMGALQKLARRSPDAPICSRQRRNASNAILGVQ
jgi:hypothetical protein